MRAFRASSSALHSGLLAVGLDELEAVRSAWAAARPDVARRDLVLADVHVVVEREREQLVGRVTLDDADAAPVIRRADDVHGAALDDQWLDPRRDQNTRLDRGARGHYRRPASMLEPALGRQLGRDLAEELGLELGEVGHGARHPAGR